MILAVVPNQVALGLCDIQVRRPRSIAVGSGDDLSSPVRLPATDQYVFGASTDDNTVLVINQQTQALTAKIPVPGQPMSTATTPDGTRVYVTLVTKTGPAVAEIDALALQLVAFIPLAFSGDGSSTLPYQIAADHGGMTRISRTRRVTRSGKSISIRSRRPTTTMWRPSRSARPIRACAVWPST